MGYLIDTNVLSESVKVLPDSNVLTWLNARLLSEVYVSVFTLAEIYKGIDRLPPSKRKSKLADWYKNELLVGFDKHILPFDESLISTWSSMLVALEKKGRPIPLIDAFIAATAHHYNLTLVTRNLTDFKDCGIALLNPWDNTIY